MGGARRPAAGCTNLNSPSLTGLTWKMKLNHTTVRVIVLLALLLGVLYTNKTFREVTHFEWSANTSVKSTCSHEASLVAPEHLHYKQLSVVHGRRDVSTVTPWLAPVVWEGTFDPDLLYSVYKPKNISIAVSVFAVGKYIRFLQAFLETAEQHFFVGFKVCVYVFTDQPEKVPQVKMASERQVKVITVPSLQRWQEITAGRMEHIQKLIEEELHGESDYIFCLDVDSMFHAHWGTESLGRLIAVLHPGYYKTDRKRFPYERRPSSTAYIAPDEGDFYYCGGAFGGSLHDVHQLTKTCSFNFQDDARRGVEAAWQEESHLNRYMWINKPSKVLSPEYLWQDFKVKELEIWVIRFSGVVKNYAEIRPKRSIMDYFF